MPPSSKTPTDPATLAALTSSSKSTLSGPSVPAPPGALKSKDPTVARFAAQGELADKFQHNENKSAEYGDPAAEGPPAGDTAEPGSRSATASTLSETNVSAKLGKDVPVGENLTARPLTCMRADSTGRKLTTNQGVPVADNQHSLKLGLRGPALLEDFILREKLTHFDHERIPERVVHARGSGAHGYFECYQSLAEITRASLFREMGKRTPVFVRFSTVAGERGSADTVRDARGFAVKFYTDEGIWDLVGNNIPVFFIQDAMKFPDLVHALKPEPHHAIPQASSAHDTFWDFVSLMPESTHMLMWVMSDRAIPRSYRMMQGFGVHTFRFLNAASESRFVKFHWTPLAGTHSLAWDEAVKIAGADADFHRRDLWEAIEAGTYPEYELGVQVFSEDQAEEWSFDVLDATKIVPEELVPITPVGRLVLNRNPDNFFGETEQVAFCAAHIVPGIDFSNDPLLAGRIHSYIDTQLTRLGGPNFHEIPVNAPVVEVHNNQRDGLHRHTLHRGRVSYEPNSLAGGSPFQGGAGAGFTSFREPIEADKVRGKPQRFAEHYTQAELFWNSQSPVEQEHIARAFRFELTRVQTPAVRNRVVAQLANVSPVLASKVAAGLGIDVPAPLPKAAPKIASPEVTTSPALSLLARPGETGVATRKIALLVADGLDAAPLLELHAKFSAAGAVPRFVGAQMGSVTDADGNSIPVEVTMEAAPAVLWDALVLPGGDAVQVLLTLGHAHDFVRDQYRHCKPILVLPGAEALLGKLSIPRTLPTGAADPGLVFGDSDDFEGVMDAFVAAVAKHRHFARETDPPSV
ncbi:MAG TPA: catalase [Steroidobacteraceae bacterium]|jgi:catalase|nr:catalase [Steroidobacteraceae bacterium]